MIRVMLACAMLMLLPGCVVREGYADRGGYYQSRPVSPGYYRPYRPHRPPVYRPHAYRPHRPPVYRPHAYRPPVRLPPVSRPYAPPPHSSNPYVYRGGGGYRPH